MRLHNILLKTPEPIPDDSSDERWKWFKVHICGLYSLCFRFYMSLFNNDTFLCGNCLGALEGTFIDFRVREIDKPQYRTRKGGISTNVLTTCSVGMEFTYVL